MVSYGTIQHFSISALGLALFSTSYTLTSLSLSVFMESWLNEPVWSDFHQSHWSSVALTTTDQMLGHIPCSATQQIPHTHTRHLFHTGGIFAPGHSEGESLDEGAKSTTLTDWVTQHPYLIFVILSPDIGLNFIYAKARKSRQNRFETK